MKLKYILVIIFILYLIFKKYEYYFRIRLLNLFVVKRGIVTLNCKWYKFSDMFLKDSSGVNLYYDIKKNIKHDFYQSTMFGHKVHLLLNTKHIQSIMDNSPYKFGPGILKKKFFNSFMKENIGISCGCPWKEKRKLIESVLPQNKNYNSQKINDKINFYLNDWKNKNIIKLKDFKNISKKISGYIIFGSQLDQVYLDYLKIVNKTSVLWNYEKNKEFRYKKEFDKLLNDSLNNPEQDSLIYKLIKNNNNLTKEQLKDQIPHFIFPIFSIFITTVPRILLMLSNHEDIYKNLILDLNRNKHNRSEYLRKIVLEMVRLNNPVNSTFRTVNQDTNFNQYQIKKGDQILILNNPVLRNPEVFEYPNRFNPERWNSKLEDSYHAISFNQGPQECPGKELFIFIVESFIINLFKIKNLNISSRIITKKINTENISQSINPCKLEFKFI
jgi:hypothetical protein